MYLLAQRISPQPLMHSHSPRQSLRQFNLIRTPSSPCGCHPHTTPYLHYYVVTSKSSTPQPLFSTSEGELPAVLKSYLDLSLPRVLSGRTLIASHFIAVVQHDTGPGGVGIRDCRTVGWKCVHDRSVPMRNPSLM